MRFVHRRNVIVTVSLLVLVTFASTSAQAHSNHGGPRLGTTTEIWIGTATTRGTLARLDSDAAAGLFGAPQSITLGEPIGAPVALSWSSERRFARDVADGSIPALGRHRRGAGAVPRDGPRCLRAVRQRRGGASAAREPRRAGHLGDLDERHGGPAGALHSLAFGSMGTT